ncbi:MAG TPA: carbamoyltransferase C-terminal domain-containing protein [Myxococcota bacterium]|nr:carbamoyltransferase C-terminal domain-containing protein [Myxococcota bacterium]HQK50297.1 carbamoyltransferase C-terminal domain-containing protein [Myxococcota bacterium]
MRVLGLNFSNDAAASLVVDGRVVMAVQEERFRRVKHYAGFPEAAIRACLKAGGLRLADLDAVAFFWNPGIHAATPSWRQSTVPRHHLEFLFDVPNHLLPQWGSPPEVMEQVFHAPGRRPLRIYYVTHHLAHAAAALFTSPHQEAAILTLDGYGERDSSVLWQARGTTFERLWTQEYPHSLGAYYAAISQYLGFKPNSGEGKAMGLASYGRPRFVDEFRRMLRLTSDGFELDLSYFQFFVERPTRFSQKMVDLLGEPRVPESEITERHQDLAASMQAVFEEAVMHLARIARERTGARVLCMSGGVTLNCLANGRLVRSGLFDDLFFQPACSDAGAGLGAALYVSHVLGQVPRAPALLLDYLGPRHSMDEVLDTLDKGGIPFHRVPDPYEAAGRLLARGFIGSVFQGAAEFGPRALGNRSTLADPRPAEMKDRLNARVKFREPFRPFAPSIQAHRAPDYFEGCTFSPFMLRVHPTRPERLPEARAVTHVDGGARVQTLEREQNPRYYDLIESFRRETGTPLVLNTSFNIRGEPIVNSPADAVKCYLTTGMDFLVLEDVLLVKNPSIL